MGQVPPRRDHGTDHLIHGPAKFSFPVKSAMETCAKYQRMIKPVQELNYGNTNVLLNKSELRLLLSIGNSTVSRGGS